MSNLEKMIRDEVEKRVVEPLLDFSKRNNAESFLIKDWNITQRGGFGWREEGGHIELSFSFVDGEVGR